jgi:hypothetical protein
VPYTHHTTKILEIATTLLPDEVRDNFGASKRAEILLIVRKRQTKLLVFCPTLFASRGQGFEPPHVHQTTYFVSSTYAAIFNFSLVEVFGALGAIAVVTRLLRTTRCVASA